MIELNWPFNICSRIQGCWVTLNNCLPQVNSEPLIDHSCPSLLCAGWSPWLALSCWCGVDLWVGAEVHRISCCVKVVHFPAVSDYKLQHSPLPPPPCDHTWGKTNSISKELMAAGWDAWLWWRPPKPTAFACNLFK